MKALKLLLPALALLQTICAAATIAISIDSGSKSMRDSTGVVLSAGAPGVARDGTQVLLGYYLNASSSAPFGIGNNEGAFIALTGPGTPFGVNFTVGDLPVNGTGNGELFVDAFGINTGVADALLPAVGTPLVLRFFNGSRTALIDLSNINSLWDWKLPAVPPSLLNINFDDPGLVCRRFDGAAVTISPSTTNISLALHVPEPGCLSLAVVGVVMMLGRRPRR